MFREGASKQILSRPDVDLPLICLEGTRTLRGLIELTQGPSKTLSLDAYLTPSTKEIPPGVARRSRTLSSTTDAIFACVSIAKNSYIFMKSGGGLEAPLPGIISDSFSEFGCRIFPSSLPFI